MASRDPVPAEQTLTLLGLAFAGADLVLEVDEAGRVGFALGAAERLTGRGDAALLGAEWKSIFADEEADLLDLLRAELQPGERQGPLRVALRGAAGARLKRHVSLSVFRLPQRGARLSCALSVAPPVAHDAPSDRWGLISPAGFAAAAATLAAEAREAGSAVRLDLVELTGLNAKIGAQDPKAAEATRRRVAAALRAESFGGQGASEIATDRYALVRTSAASSARLAERLEKAAGDAVSAITAELPLSPEGAAQDIKIMRYALDRFIEDGPAAAALSFTAAVERTRDQSQRFKAILAAATFRLAYQPVVALADRQLQHFEALARFEPDTSPADTIRLAEELDLIADFDLAVAKSVAMALAASPGLRVAVNVSAVSLNRPRFVEALLALTSGAPAIRRRLLIEVTETHALDVPQASAVIAHLKKAGHSLCLDDFGSGSASLDYLRRLDVDFVKIDGAFVTGLTERPRDAVVLKHVVALCRELGIRTIAEMIETPEVARVAEDLGVDYGQGWAFSKPLPKPVWAPPKAAASAARRKGAVEQWG